MRSNISLLWSIIILGAVGITCAAAIIFFANPDAAGQYTSLAPTPPAAAQTPQIPIDTISSEAMVGIPVRLVIPTINIDAPIAPAGLTADGAMGVPVGPTSTTWFDLGPRPGQIGSAVIAGHEGWKDGIFAIFDNLHELQPGDKIYIVDDQGATTTFVVRALQLYDQNASAAPVFSSSDGQAHLNLITCEGTWNAAQQSYSNRLVVFADEETG
ncbi:MAG TPA: class F sortase [Candidatus Paceibacterota bacterium]|nr:class F sortase [Candidatus Paceibacterota bacterium]